jgi:hypothetical protein
MEQVHYTGSRFQDTLMPIGHLFSSPTIINSPAQCLADTEQQTLTDETCPNHCDENSVRSTPNSSPFGVAFFDKFSVRKLIFSEKGFAYVQIRPNSLSSYSRCSTRINGLPGASPRIHAGLHAAENGRFKA